MAFFASEWSWQPSELDGLDAEALEFWLGAADELRRGQGKQ